MSVRNVHIIIDLFFLAAISAVMISCDGKAMNRKSSCDFSSLAEEQEFWKKWIKEHHGGPCRLEPFFRERESGLWKQVNEKLLAITKVSEHLCIGHPNEC